MKTKHNNRSGKKKASTAAQSGFFARANKLGRRKQAGSRTKQTTGGRASAGQKSGAAGQKYSAKTSGAAGMRFVGTIEGNPRGYGFLIVPNAEEDLFIPAHGMNGAVHGDTVEAVLAEGNSGRGMAAEVVSVLSRRYTRVVGTYFKHAAFGIVVPDELRVAGEITVSQGETGGAKHLDKVVVEPDYARRAQYLSGKVVEVLGQGTDKGVDILSIIRSYNLYETFPAHVVKEAARVAVPPGESDLAGRTDYRDELIFTIDGDDSKDFDDAVCVTELPNGNFRLGVHIADVAHYVAGNSALDKEALKRGTSVYFCDRVLPMLPEKLSNDICSLNEGADRLTLSAVMEIDRAGTVVRHEIREGVIRSRARMTYSAVSKILDGDELLCAQYAHLVPTLQTMNRLAKILFKKRQNRGNIDFDLPECELVLDEKGHCINVLKKNRLISHRIIEEFMLAANETVAEHFAKLKAPFVYRAHEDPPSEKTETLMDLLKALGISFSGDSEKPSPRDFSNLLRQVAGGTFETAVSRIALRTMSKACYTPENKGHFGLAAEFYCHFTSPIRRYPDLAIHRIIKDYLKNGPVCFSKYRQFAAVASQESSERERLAEKAERDVDDLKKAEYMSDKIGNCYSAVISGVTEWGIFAELDNTVEGMIRTENLPGSGYEHDRRSARLTNGIHSYRIGDKIEIEVAGVNGLKVEFKLFSKSERQ